jgi:hypothetical protein
VSTHKLLALLRNCNETKKKANCFTFGTTDNSHHIECIQTHDKVYVAKKKKKKKKLKNKKKNVFNCRNETKYRYPAYTKIFGWG